MCRAECKVHLSAPRGLLESAGPRKLCFNENACWLRVYAHGFVVQAHVHFRYVWSFVVLHKASPMMRHECEKQVAKEHGGLRYTGV